VLFNLRVFRISHAELSTPICNF